MSPHVTLAGTRAVASSGPEAPVEFVRTIEIDAPPAGVWTVMSDVERWPEWTASVTGVRRLDHGPLRLGSRAVIRQPRFPPASWTVTTLEPGRRFVWKSGMPGLWVHGDHSVAPHGAGAQATLRLSYEGLLARLMGRLTRGITNRYLDLEAAGLKRRSENDARAAVSAS